MCNELESVRLGEIWRDAERLGEGQEKCGCINPPEELPKKLYLPNRPTLLLKRWFVLARTVSVQLFEDNGTKSR